MSNGDLVWDLEIELLLYIERWEEIGLRTEGIKNSLKKSGVVETVRSYGTGSVDAGLKEARVKLGPEWTMEALLLDERFAELFTERDRQLARKKLEQS